MGIRTQTRSVADNSFIRDIGEVRGDGASTNQTWQELIFDGANDGAGTVFLTRRMLRPQGANSFPNMMVDYKGIINECTAGTATLAYASHSYIWLAGGQTIANGRVYFGHFVNSGTANVNIGIVYFAGDTTLNTGSGIISTLLGFATGGDFGHATRVGNANGFHFTNTRAAGLVKAFYSNQNADANRYWNLYFEGTAPSWIFGNLQVGGVAALSDTKLYVRDTWDASGTTYYGVALDIADTAHAAASRLLRLAVGGALRLDVDVAGNVVATGNLQLGSTSLMTFGSRSRITAADGDGILRMANNAANDFTRLIFGSNNTSGIAIKKNGTAFNFRLGNDSGDADVTTGVISMGMR